MSPGDVYWVVEIRGAVVYHWHVLPKPGGLAPSIPDGIRSRDPGAKVVSGPFFSEAEAEMDASARYDVQDVMEVLDVSLERGGLP